MFLYYLCKTSIAQQIRCLGASIALLLVFFAQPGLAKLPELAATTLSGDTTSARFYAGISADNGQTFGRNFQPNDLLDINGEIQVEAEHVGQSGNLYLILGMGEQYFFRNEGGEFIEWDLSAETLQPTESKTLAASEAIMVLDDVAFGPLDLAGFSFTMFLGYDTGNINEQLYFSEVPAVFSITGSDPVNAPEQGPMAAIGDSYFEFHAESGDAIPDVVGQTLGREMQNLAVSGAQLFPDDPEATDEGLDIPAQLPVGEWDWLVMDGGGNDFNDRCGCGLCDSLIDSYISEGGTEGRLTDFLRSVTDRGTRVVYMTYPELPPGAEFGFDRCEDEFEVFDARLERMAAALDGVWIVDASEVVSADDLNAFDADRVHPSVLGAQRIGEHIAERILAFEASNGIVPANDVAWEREDGTGAFRTHCLETHVTFDDPLVHPGRPGAAHEHVFLGNPTVDAFTTQETLLEAAETDCDGGTINRSAYWMPSLYDANRERIRYVDPLIYYKTGYHVPPESIVPPPEGLQMIAGNAMASTPQDVAVTKFRCNSWTPEAPQFSPGDPLDHVPTLPDCEKGDILEIRLVFPQCWDGVNLTSPDLQSHMAYPSPATAPTPGTGACPPSHPVAIPEISYNLGVYITEETGPSRYWRFVTDPEGAPGGTTLHGDWMNGWDEDVMGTIVEHCLNAARECMVGLLGDGTMLRPVPLE